MWVRLQRRQAGRLVVALGSSVVAPVVVAALAFLVIGYGQSKAAGRKHTIDPSVFIKAGSLFEAPALLPHQTVIFRPAGYDGQFFFYLAQDPLLTGKAAKPDEVSSPHIDDLAYRYQRILLPVLGWLTSWGDPQVLQWSLPLINLIAVLGAGFLLARFSVRHGRSPWLSLAFMLSLGVVVGVVDDLSDPLAAGLFVAGVVAWLEVRPVPAAIALTGCMLAREIYLVPVAIICLSELARRGRRAWLWLAPPLVWGVWELYLRLAFAASPTAGAHDPALVPLLGAARKLKLVLNQDPWGVANWEIAFIGLLLIIWLVFFVRSIDMLRLRIEGHGLSREQLLPVVGVATVVFVPFLTLALWTYIPSYSRYAAPAGGLMVLAYAIRPDRVLRGLMFALLLLSLTSPIIGVLPSSGPAGGPAIGIGFPQ